MTVSELIEHLQKLNPDLDVVEYCDEQGCYGDKHQRPIEQDIVRSNGCFSFDGENWVEDHGYKSGDYDGTGEGYEVYERRKVVVL